MLAERPAAVSKRQSFSMKRDAAWHVMPSDELSDAEESRLYTACHWPFYVWKRMTHANQMALSRLTDSTAAGLARMRCFRRWSVDAAIFAKERAFGRRLRARHQQLWMQLFVDRLGQLAASRSKYAALQRSGTFVSMRARAVCSAPWRALQAYALCRALVRRRSLGEMMIRREAKVPPLPVPPEWRVHPIVGAMVERYHVKDVHTRRVNRHCRQRLSPLLLELLALNVQLSRRKRYCALRGYALVYYRCLTQWVAYVLLGIRKDEDAKAAAEAEARASLASAAAGASASGGESDSAAEEEATARMSMLEKSRERPRRRPDSAGGLLTAQRAREKASKAEEKRQQTTLTATLTEGERKALAVAKRAEAAAKAEARKLRARQAPETAPEASAAAATSAGGAAAAPGGSSLASTPPPPPPAQPLEGDAEDEDEEEAEESFRRPRRPYTPEEEAADNEAAADVRSQLPARPPRTHGAALQRRYQYPAQQEDATAAMLAAEAQRADEGGEDGADDEEAPEEGAAAGNAPETALMSTGTLHEAKVLVEEAAEAAAAAAAALPPAEPTTLDGHVAAWIERHERKLAVQRLNARPATPLDDDAVALPAREAHEAYSLACRHRKGRLTAILDSVRHKGSRLERRGEQRAKRFEHQRELRANVDARSAELLHDASARVQGALTLTTDELAVRLAAKAETLVSFLLHAWALFDVAWSRQVVVECYDALKEPLRWKRAIALSNRWKLRRMVRIATRFLAIERSIPTYRRLRVQRAVLWGWLYATAAAIGAARPGFNAMLRRRRQLLLLFSRLLVAERSPRCPRCLFARWLEYTHLKVTRRSIVGSSRERRDARWLGRCFYAWRTGKGASTYDERVAVMLEQGAAYVPNPAEGLGGAPGSLVPMLRSYPPWAKVVYGGQRELAAATELDKWVTKILRPELHTEWVRRKNRWVRRRMLRLAAESVMRQLLLAARADLDARIKHEAELHFEASADPDAMPSPYLSSALQLREFELKALWTACLALAKALVHSERDEKPAWLEPLTKPFIAVGLARWMANGLSHGLPKVHAVDAAGEPLKQLSTLPKPGDGHKGQHYWKHHEWLLMQAKERQKAARHKL